MKEHFPYLFWAYNIIWILITAYLVMLFARQRSLRRQIEDLRSRLDSTEGRTEEERRGLLTPGADDVLDGEIVD